jgi:hypothetical protein
MPDDIVEEKAVVALRPADHYLAAPPSTAILIAEP